MQECKKQPVHIWPSMAAASWSAKAAHAVTAECQTTSFKLLLPSEGHPASPMSGCNIWKSAHDSILGIMCTSSTWHLPWQSTIYGCSGRCCDKHARPWQAASESLSHFRSSRKVWCNGGSRKSQHFHGSTFAVSCVSFMGMKLMSIQVLKGSRLDLTTSRQPKPQWKTLYGGCGVDLL